MSPMPVENTLMSTRPMEKTIAAPERLDLESRTAWTCLLRGPAAW